MENNNLKNKKIGYLILGILGIVLFITGIAIWTSVFTVQIVSPIRPVLCMAMIFVGMILAKIGFSPFEAKFKAKIGKDVVDINKKELEELGKSVANVTIKTKKGIQEEYGEELEEIATREAEIKAKGTKRTAKAIKEGFAEDEQVFCRFCGESIAKDSQFCKYCGKKQ